MINFQTDLDRSPTGTLIVSAPTVTVTTRRPVKTHESRTHLVSTSDGWTWEQLRDYVVGEIEAKQGGRFPRNPITEKATFSSFVNRYKENAGPIAKCAFETYDGMWKGAPVSVNRFCKGSDAYFADPILAALRGE